MKTKSKTADETSLASRVAHEDLRVGDYVAVLNEIVEFPAFFWSESSVSAEDELIRVPQCATDGGTPLKIRAICLPFVYVKSAEGTTETIDVRMVQLVRLQKRYAKIVWNDCRKQRANKEKKPEER